MLSSTDISNLYSLEIQPKLYSKEEIGYHIVSKKGKNKKNNKIIYKSDKVEVPVSITFSESQRRIKASRYERHLSFQEQISILMLYLEEQLPKDLKPIAKNMFNSHGEWCNQAYEIIEKGNKFTLIFYEGIREIEWAFQYNNKKEFDISDLRAEYIYIRSPPNVFVTKKEDLKYVELNLCKEILKQDIISLRFEIANILNPPTLKNNLPRFFYFKNIHKSHEDLVKYIYTREFNELPDQIKENAGIWLSEPGHSSVVTRGDFRDKFLFSGYDPKLGYSRGCKTK